MNMNSWNREAQIPIARAIAIVAHRDQKYGDGRYADHLAGVAQRVYEATQGRDILVAAAWLHDILEDTDVTLEDLRHACVSPPVRRLVEILTRRKGETYADYIERVALDRDATRIKIADLNYNLSHDPSETQRQRYIPALQLLTARFNNGTRKQS